jgi:hypothetical protein
VRGTDSRHSAAIAKLQNVFKKWPSHWIPTCANGEGIYALKAVGALLATLTITPNSVLVSVDMAHACNFFGKLPRTVCPFLEPFKHADDHYLVSPAQRPVHFKIWPKVVDPHGPTANL